jgi:TatD DNase family protein
VIVDSHCHLADDKFAGDLDAVVARAQEAGVSRALCILSADEPEEVARATRVTRGVAGGTVSRRRFTRIAPVRMRAAWRRLRALPVKRPNRRNAVAIGEIGLDYHYDFAPRDVQADVFAAQIAVALDQERPGRDSHP